MRVANLKGEKDLSELIERLFDIRKADPFLVPDLEGIKYSTQDHELSTIFTELSKQLQNALTSVRARFKDTEEDNLKETRATLRQLKTKKVSSLLGEDPDVKKKTDEVTNELEMRVKDSEALQKFHESALDQVRKDLMNLGEFANRFASMAVAKQRLSAAKSAVTTESSTAPRSRKSRSRKKR